MNVLSPPLRIVTECLRPKGGGFAASRRRRNTGEWMASLGIANEHLLAPAMYASLAASHHLSSVPSDVQDYLMLLHRRNAERNAALRRQALQLLRALQTAAIPAMLLKGALSLFLDYYPNRGARLFRDLDVLVPAKSMPGATAVLEELGYRAKNKYWPVQHAYAEFMRPNDPGALDLHVELIDASYILPIGEVWRRAGETAEDGIRFFVPSPTDRILHNVLHSQIHYLGNFYLGTLELRQVYDFALMARRYADEIDWREIERRMAEHRLETPLQSYALAASTLFDLPWPLRAPPSLAARFHFQRCLAQLRFPLLQRFAVPWGNLRAAFAWHRMNALYGDAGRSAAGRQLRHAVGFLRKSNAKGVLNRLFRIG